MQARLHIPSGYKRPRTLCTFDRAVGSLLETLGPLGETFVSGTKVRSAPGALRLCRLPRRPLDGARKSSPCTLVAASPSPGEEPRRLGPDEPGHRAGARQDHCSPAPRLHPEPGARDDGGKRQGVPEPARVAHSAQNARCFSRPESPLVRRPGTGALKVPFHSAVATGWLVASAARAQLSSPFSSLSWSFDRSAGGSR